MEPVQNQNPQLPPIFNPQPIIPVQQLPVQSFQPAPPPKKSYWKIIFGALTSLVLIFVLTFGYFFWWAPETAAKEFIEKTSSSFIEISGEADTVFSDFKKIKEESTLAQAAFSEITKTTKDYNYTKKDTQEDINDISSVLPKVKEAKAQIESLKKPEKVEKLASALQDYYSTLEETLEELLKHENLQLKEIEAHGQELYDSLQKQAEFTGDVDRTEYVSLLRKISNEAFEAKARTELIGDVDPAEEIQLKSRIEYFQDLGESYEQATLLFEKGEDQTGWDLISDFGKRVKKLNEGIQQSADRFVVESKPAIGFAKLPDLEAKVLEEFKNFNINIPENEEEATPSATPEQVSTPSAQPLQSTPSATFYPMNLP